jgi:hypothetical protein
VQGLSFTSTDRPRCITSGRPVAGGWLSLPGALDSANGAERYLLKPQAQLGRALLFHTITLVGRSLPFLPAFRCLRLCPGITHMYSIIIPIHSKKTSRKNEKQKVNHLPKPELLCPISTRSISRRPARIFMEQRRFRFFDVLGCHIHVHVDQRPCICGIIIRTLRRLSWDCIHLGQNLDYV